MRFAVFPFVLVICLFSFVQTVNAEQEYRTNCKSDAGNLDFVENVGQWQCPGRFRSEIPGGVVFITDQGFVYNYISEHDLAKYDSVYQHNQTIPERADKTTQIRRHAYWVKFLGANKSIKYETRDRREFYYNYFFGRDTSMWKGNVGAYRKVIQKGVYDGIDVAVYSIGRSLKYDFVVDPGVSTAQIALSFDGVKPRLTKEGNLTIATSINEVTEQAPYAYQIIDGREVSVPCRYKLKDGVLSFDFPGGYDTAIQLIIDPTVVFATYSGSIGDRKYGYASTFDTHGNMYTAGKDNNPDIGPVGGWPTTPGAFITQAIGRTPVTIAKYSSSGSTLLYATYLSGASDPLALTVTESGELFILGMTGHNTMMSIFLPVTPGCYDNTENGNHDLYIAHFNSLGTALIGCTLIGGSGEEGHPQPFTIWDLPNSGELLVDSAGNIWVVSNTNSQDFPVTPDAQQSTYAGGVKDGILFKLSNDCSQLLYSSYVGGINYDAPHGMIFNHSGNLVICGETNSQNFPITGGVMKTTTDGYFKDGFVTIIRPSDGSILKSSYIGTPSADAACFLDVDAEDNIYVLGTTLGNYPVSPSAYNVPGGDVFVDKVKFDLTSSLKSTRLGNPSLSSQYFVPSGFTLDHCENIYLAGFCSSVNIPITSNAIQSSHTELWFGVVGSEFSSLLFGSFFGPPYASTGTGVIGKLWGQQRFDKSGFFYHAISYRGSNFPTTPGSYSPIKQNLAGSFDAVSFKIDVSEFAPVDTISTFQRDTSCYGHGVTLIATDTTGFAYLWNTRQWGKTLTVNEPGVYTVRYRRKDDMCKVYVDSFIVEKIPFPNVITYLRSCPNTKVGSVEVTKGTGSYYYNYILKKDGSTTIFDVQSDSGFQKKFLGLGNYSLQIRSTAGCDTTVFFTIESLPTPIASFIVDSIVCTSEGFQIVNSSAGDFSSWLWSFGDGRTSTAFTPPRHSYPDPGIYTIELSMQGDYCTDTIRKEVLVKELQLNLVSNDELLEFGNLLNLRSAASEVYTIYRWMPEWLFANQSAYEQTIKADSSRAYVIIGISEHGCIDTTTATVRVVSTGVYLPSAFSPNSDGRNDFFRPVSLKGDPFKVRFFRIYDRWGKMVWGGYGTDAFDGWDGSYSGTPAEVGTYYYTIEVETYTGKTISQKGDVALIR